MQSGNQISRPNITRASLEAALHLLTYTIRDSSDGITLKTLVLVDEFLDSPHRPMASDLRRYALSTILTEIITDQLTQVRRLFDLSDPATNAPMSVVKERILEDSQQNSAELSGWSFLYYHYVRSELGISQDKYAKISHVAPRTVRRYSGHILDILVDVIIQREWAARQRRHRQSLKEILPLSKNQVFTGREAEMTSLKRWLTGDEPGCILVTGSVDCGKTTLVNQCLHDLIDETTPDYLFWFDGMSASLELIQQTLLDTTHSQSHEQLTRLLARRHTIVVLDNVHHLRPSAIQQITESLKHTIYIFLTHKPPLINDVMHHIELSPLNLEDLLFVARQIVPFMPEKDLYRRVHSLWKESGSHSSWLTPILTQPDYNIEVTSADLNYVDVCKHLSDTACHVWWLLAFQQGRRTHAVKYLLPELRKTFGSAMQELRYYALLTSKRDALFVTNSAAEFIRQRYQTSDNLLEQALDLFKDVRNPVFRACLLLRAGNYLSAETVRDIILSCWQRQSVRSNLLLWAEIFDMYQQQVIDDPLLLLLYGKFLSYRHDFNAAYQVLNKAVSLAGIQGDFRLQLRNRLALVTLLRETSHYKFARSELNAIKDALSRYESTELKYDFLLEKAQLLFETLTSAPGDFFLSDLFQQADTENNQVAHQIVRAEYYLSTDEIEACRHLADDILQRQQDLLPAGTMAIFTILGRSYMTDGQIKRGIDWLNAALSLLEQQNNTRAAARAQTNLGGALILMKTPEAYQEAEVLLKRAEAHQHIIEDTVGLNVTCRNLNILAEVRSQA